MEVHVRLHTLNVHAKCMSCTLYMFMSHHIGVALDVRYNMKTIHRVKIKISEKIETKNGSKLLFQNKVSSCSTRYSKLSHDMGELIQELDSVMV